MAAIVAELPAVGKDEFNEAQKFKFRSHDAAMNVLKPLLGKHGVYFVPDVLKRITEQRTTKHGSVMYEVNLHVQYTFYGANGDYVTASAWGEGTDSGDKATNKAMTMALKNVVAQTFALSTAETAAYDTDGSTDPETVKKPASGSAGPAKRKPRPEAKTAASASAAGTASAGIDTAAAHGNTVERDNEDTRLVSEEQRKELFELVKEVGVSGARYREIIEYTTGQPTPANIPASRFKDVVNAVKAENVPFG
jgi:hypothetical protein